MYRLYKLSVQQSYLQSPFGMLSCASLRVLSRPALCAFSSTASAHVVAQPKPSLTLDPSLKSLLQDVDISLMSKWHEAEEPTSLARELEALENGEGEIEYHDMDREEYLVGEPARRREDRKSPAARFGSDGISTVVLSPELQRTITALIEGIFLFFFSHSTLVIVYRCRQDIAAQRCKTSICGTGKLGRRLVHGL